MVCLPVIHTYLWVLSKQKTTAEERYIRSPLSRSVHQTERRKYLFVEGICSMIFAPDWVCELVQCIVHSVENLGCLKRSRESVVWRPLSEIFQSTSCLHFSVLSRSSVGFTKRSMKMNGLTCFKAAGKCEVFILAVSLKESILLWNAAACGWKSLTITLLCIFSKCPLRLSQGIRPAVCRSSLARLFLKQKKNKHTMPRGCQTRRSLSKHAEWK